MAAGLIGKNDPDENGLRGVVINTGGVEAFNGCTGQAAISAASGAIHSLTQPLAFDFAQQGIRVVSIAPGFIRTRLNDHFPVETEEAIATETITAPRRFGYPDEFAQTVQAIVANPYLNATTIEVSAGLNFNM